jgi:aminoglycoside 3-N-acetyltransferase
MSLVNSISDKAIALLPDKWLINLRLGYFKLRRSFAPLAKTIYGTFDTEDLRNHLEQELGSDFDILMVHSSINGMSPHYTGTALELVKMLRDFCGPGKTLVMPAFYFGDPAIGSVYDTFKLNPVFDLRKSSSQMGLATELFRRSKGVLQSRHPVYRVAALGPKAEALVKGHETATTPAGYNTPFDYMANHNTIILGMGKSFQVITQVHHIEDSMGEKFPVPRAKPKPGGGVEVTVIDRDIKSSLVLRTNGIKWRLNMERLPNLLEEGDLRCWKFHNVSFFAARADTMTASLRRAAENGKTLYEPD